MHGELFALSGSEERGKGAKDEVEREEVEREEVEREEVEKEEVAAAGQNEKAGEGQ